MGLNRIYGKLLGLLLILSVNTASAQWIPIPFGTGGGNDTADGQWASTSSRMYVSANGDTARNTSTSCGRAYSTFPLSTGKRRYEIIPYSSVGYMAVGLYSINTNSDCEVVADSTGYLWAANALYYSNSSAVTPNYTGGYVSGDTITVYIDFDNGAFYMSKNGVFAKNKLNVTGDPTSGASKTGALISWTPDGRQYYACAGFATPNIYLINCGKYPFRYPDYGYTKWTNPAP